MQEIAKERPRDKPRETPKGRDKVEAGVGRSSPPKRRVLRVGLGKAGREAGPGQQPCQGVVKAATQDCRSVSMAVRNTWVTSSASSSASSPGTWLEVRATLLGQGYQVMEDAIWGWGLWSLL